MRIVDPVAQHSGRAALMERVAATRRAKEREAEERQHRDDIESRREAGTGEAQSTEGDA